jgi:hypothetical protein
MNSNQQDMRINRTEARQRATLRLADQTGHHEVDIPDSRPHAWISAAPRSPGFGLPGQVQLAPSVWLCCVYLSSHASERVDANREAVRLDRLLRAAADAWLRQRPAAGMQAGTCVFCFRPDPSESAGHEAIGSSPGFLIRINALPGNNGEMLTRLDFAG